jgi:hypothetical protein
MTALSVTVGQTIELTYIRLSSSDATPVETLRRARDQLERIRNR